MSEHQLLDRINAIPITHEDLLALHSASLEYRARDPEVMASGDAGMFLAVRIAHNDANRAFAPWSRMSALAQLLEAEGAPGWTLPNRSDDGAIFAQDVLLQAAAVHPLVADGNAWVFERESFLARVLALSESDTEA